MHKFIEWPDADVIARKYEKAFCVVRSKDQVLTLYIKNASYTNDPDGILEMFGLSITSMATEIFYGHPEYCHIANGWYNSKQGPILLQRKLGKHFTIGVNDENFMCYKFVPPDFYPIGLTTGVFPVLDMPVIRVPKTGDFEIISPEVSIYKNSIYLFNKPIGFIVEDQMVIKPDLEEILSETITNHYAH